MNLLDVRNMILKKDDAVRKEKTNTSVYRYFNVFKPYLIIWDDVSNQPQHFEITERKFKNNFELHCPDAGILHISFCSRYDTSNTVRIVDFPIQKNNNGEVYLGECAKIDLLDDGEIKFLEDGTFRKPHILGYGDSEIKISDRSFFVIRSHDLWGGEVAVRIFKRG